MMLRRLFGRPCVAESVLCLLGLVASLIPALVYTYPFWGVRTYFDKELFSNDAPGVFVTEIDAGSPVESAGMRPHDHVTSFNSKPVQFGNFREALAKVEPGEPITIDVKRDGKHVRLEYEGETSKLEGVLFFDWQFVSAPAFLVLLLLRVATQPLMPAPLWRETVVTLVGLGIVIVTIVIEATQRMPWTSVWQSKSIAPPALHLTLAAIVLMSGLVLSLLGAMGIRAFLICEAHRRAAAKPPSAGK
jgi:membrane-associated protease RseP (regulator of RpoE activity)